MRSQQQLNELSILQYRQRFLDLRLACPAFLHERLRCQRTASGANYSRTSVIREATHWITFGFFESAFLMIDSCATTLLEVSSSGSVSMRDSSFRTLSKRFFRLVIPLPPSSSEGMMELLKTNHGKGAKIRQLTKIFAYAQRPTYV